MKYVYAVGSFLLGVILAGAVFWGVYLHFERESQDRFDKQIKASQVLVSRIGDELNRERQSHQLTRESLGRAEEIVDSVRLELAGRDKELRRLREITNRDTELIESSANGIDWIIEVLERLPVLE